MRFIYFYTASVNGIDQNGHYIRGALQVNVCSGRSSIRSPGCESDFARYSGAKLAGATDNQLLDYLLGGDKK